MSFNVAILKDDVFHFAFATQTAEHTDEIPIRQVDCEVFDDVPVAVICPAEGVVVGDADRRKRNAAHIDIGVLLDTKVGFVFVVDKSCKFDYIDNQAAFV